MVSLSYLILPYNIQEIQLLLTQAVQIKNRRDENLFYDPAMGKLLQQQHTLQK